MPAKRKPVCNDNSYFRHHYNGSDDSGQRVRLMRYIPTARKLIKRYSKHSWKHTPEHSEYAFLEYQLCTLLERKVQSSIQRNFQISDMAWVLEQNPVMLFNDPALTF